MDLVRIENNQIITSSRKIAVNFEKMHKHVIDNIREILKAEFSATRFFKEIVYKVPNCNKPFPEFLMNRDGFTLLAMGFTGAKALQWKIKYIEAFNTMEAQLMQQKIEEERKQNNLSYPTLAGVLACKLVKDHNAIQEMQQQISELRTIVFAQKQQSQQLPQPAQQLLAPKQNLKAYAINLVQAITQKTRYSRLYSSQSNAHTSV